MWTFGLEEVEEGPSQSCRDAKASLLLPVAGAKGLQGCYLRRRVDSESRIQNLEHARQAD
jgi:hypothetical protein